MTKTAKVINLDAHRPHQQGPVRCKSCGKKWQAVWLASEPVEMLECPDCGMQNAEIRQ